MMPRRALLTHHLQWNHYPPVSAAFVPTAERAIEWAESDQWNVRLLMPNGVTLTVAEVVEQLHLADFIQADDDDGAGVI